MTDATGPLDDGEYFVAEANRELAAAFEEPMSLATFVSEALERPSIAAHANRYVLDAIESAGTRTVVEEGDDRERYRFFDDPYNDGEHAIQGNTDVLNAFVEDLRAIATGRGKDEKIIWFAGPTATGKSELKRCLISGLREYSKTDAGRRYTVEWNLSTVDHERGLSYGDPPGRPEPDADSWYQSPVQGHPLLVFPRPVRDELIETINERADTDVALRLEGEIDPFSREAFEYLERHYSRRGTDDLFARITDRHHLRVSNYVMDVGRGIGVLQPEDSGHPTVRLVGTWMEGMLRELGSRGRKDPQAFSYDGVLSQGNSGLTIVEDAAQHADLLQKLLIVPDEGRVNLDRGIGMSVDTQLVIISNPDLEARLDQHADAGGSDPLKAFKRRLTKHEFRYLTNVSLETQLLRRELTDETAVWVEESYAEIEARMREAVRLPVAGDHAISGYRELAPHVLEGAAMYAVLTRLDEEDLPAQLSLVEKALLYDRGYHFEGDERYDKEDLAIEGVADGRSGIPVTYTRDVIAELLYRESERTDPELPVEDVIMPRDVLGAMADRLGGEPVFSPRERSTFEDRVVAAKRFVFDRQEVDVLDAMMDERNVDPERLHEYVEHVYAWGTDETLVDERGEAVEPDSLRMKVIEVEHLGRFGEDAYDDGEPSDAVERFRQEQIITAVNRYAWEQRDEDFGVSDVTVTDIPAIRNLVERSSWEDVHRVYPDLEPDQWADPPADTQTADVKRRTIVTLTDRFGYSPASAELTSQYVLAESSTEWGGNA